MERGPLHALSKPLTTSVVASFEALATSAIRAAAMGAFSALMIAAACPCGAETNEAGAQEKRGTYNEDGRAQKHT